MSMPLLLKNLGCFCGLIKYFKIILYRRQL
nr:MAG TPA_asm: hypothetical protein [Bacteriophage sp.]